MFSIEKKIFCKVFHTSFETVPLSRFYYTKVNPGARRRIKLNQDKQELDPNDLDYEADFKSVHHSHKQHMEEMENQKEKLQYNIVKQKYFKTKYPNFLTWHDKEQIKLLHRRDPDEWNVNKLSEGFPALPEIIKKILKSNWKKESLAKIKSHDVAVQENWRKLKNDEFQNLPPNLVEHLRKFSERDLNFEKFEDFKVDDRIEFDVTNRCTEFSEIITSYNELMKKHSHRDNPRKIEIKSNDKYFRYQKNDEEDTYISGPIKNQHMMTLDSLKTKLEADVNRGQQVSCTDIQIVESTETKIVHNSQTCQMRSPSKDELASVKYHTGSISELDEKTTKDYAHLVYPEKIIIPKKILKRGYTYKLNDCYYDSDGTFLYRVPGMY